MRVRKRGTRGFEVVQFDKITQRIRILCKGLVGVDPVLIAQSTIQKLFNGISTEELDKISAEVAESHKLTNPAYSTLAARILISNLHKTTHSVFSECMIYAKNEINAVSDEHIAFIRKYASELDKMICHERDYAFSYFGCKTLIGSYLNKRTEDVFDAELRPVIIDYNGTVIDIDRVVFTPQGAPKLPTRTTSGETIYMPLKFQTTTRVIDRPQYMYMRVATAMYMRAIERGLADLGDLFKYYNCMSYHLFTHATPSLFNACAPIQQMDSCFLFGTGDSIEAIMKTLTDTSLTSKRAGGIGIHMHCIRSAGSKIRGTNGSSSGLPRQLCMYNNAARCWDQGGRRLGAFAVYLEPWHGDILAFLRLKLSQGADNERARDLFYALWVPDLFVHRAKRGEPLSLFSEDTAPGLSDVYDGMEVCIKCGFCYNSAYNKYVAHLPRTKVVYAPWRETVLALDSSKTPGHTAGSMMVIPDLDQTSTRMQALTQSLNTQAPPTTLWMPAHVECEPRAPECVRAPERAPECVLKCVHEFEPRDAFTELYNHYENIGCAVGAVNSREVITAMCKLQAESGTPYIGHKDHVNRMSNQMNIGTVKSSNLCVAPETILLTSTGPRRIIDCAGKEIQVWNGRGFSKVTPRLTGVDQPLIRVTLTNGVTVDCTSYHKFAVVVGRGDPISTPARDLRAGDKMITYSLPVIYDGDQEFPHAYTHGVFCALGSHEIGVGVGCASGAVAASDCANATDNPIIVVGDGCVAVATGGAVVGATTPRRKHVYANACGGDRDLPLIVLQGAKRAIQIHLDRRIHDETRLQDIYVRLPNDIYPKLSVPVHANLATRVLWFAGICDGSGLIVRMATGYLLRVGSPYKAFLLNVRHMLQTMGVDSEIMARPSVDTIGPPDTFWLIVSAFGIEHLVSLGFTPHLTLPPYPRGAPADSLCVLVESVIDYGRISDTYCFTEQHRGMGMFNGVLTYQCMEIMEVSTKDSYACCTLASINLAKFVVAARGTDFCRASDAGDVTGADSSAATGYVIDHVALHETARLVVRNLDTVIDENAYPVPECKTNSLAYRPIAIGIQGLADVFMMMRIPYLSPEAEKIDISIAETIYHAALSESVAMAKERGQYSAFEGSPASRGELHYHLWMKNQRRIKGPFANRDPRTGRYDFAVLIDDVTRYGLRCSLHCANMPTVSTSQVLGNNECFEPISSNMYTKTFLGGKQTVVNTHLVAHLTELGLWSQDMRDRIIADGGSVLSIESIPANVREIYRTVWEMKQKELIIRSALRQAFIDQSQSMNIHVTDNSEKVLRAIFFASWDAGCKTGSYYIRTKPAVRALRINMNNLTNSVPSGELSVGAGNAHNDAGSAQAEVCNDGACTLSCGS